MAANTRVRGSYSMEFKCKVVTWYLDNLESYKENPDIRKTRWFLGKGFLGFFRDDYIFNQFLMFYSLQIHNPITKKN